MSTAEGAKYRLTSIDALRGMVMIIMALDHTREFVHASAMVFQPEDLTRTNAILFFTRWVTHICAPVFVFTAGLGAYFWKSHGRTSAQLSKFLWSRGLWLIILDLTVIRFALTFSMMNGVLILSLVGNRPIDDRLGFANSHTNAMAGGGEHCGNCFAQFDRSTDGGPPWVCELGMEDSS